MERMFQFGKFIRKNLMIFISTSLILIVIYLTILYALTNFYIASLHEKSFSLNEYAGFINGILTPIFSILSAAAIILLTYVIARNESEKADEAIYTQKRITLNQMRQDALNRLADKLNLFVYEFEKLNVSEKGDGKFVRMVTAKLNREKGKENTFVWLIILSELENFLQLEYLFNELFNDKEFKKIYGVLTETADSLNEEQIKLQSITDTNLIKYVETKQKMITKIGNYIYSEF